MTVAVPACSDWWDRDDPRHLGGETGGGGPLPRRYQPVPTRRLPSVGDCAKVERLTVASVHWGGGGPLATASWRTASVPKCIAAACANCAKVATGTEASVHWGGVADRYTASVPRCIAAPVPTRRLPSVGDSPDRHVPAVPTASHAVYIAPHPTI